MKIKNKKISILLSMFIMIGLLTGCVGNQTKSDEKAKTASDKKVVIEYWHPNAETQGGIAINELVEKFNNKNDHIKVVPRFHADMYKGLMQNLQAEQAAGKIPDIVQIGWAFSEYFGNNFKYLSPQDAIKKFDKKDSKFLEKNFLPNVLKLAKNEKGELMGLPYSMSTPVLYINKDLLKKSGLDTNGPKTWEEVAKFAKAVKDKTGKYGLYVQEYSDFWGQQAIMESNGAEMMAKEGNKVKATFASPEGVKAMDYCGSMVKNGLALHMQGDQALKSFIDGSIAMYYTTIAKSTAIEKGAKFKAAALKSPLWEGKARKIPVGGSFLAITAKDEAHQKAAWEFEKYLYSIENVAAWSKGTGYLPPRKDVAESKDGLKDYLEKHQMMNAAISQMNDVVPWVSFPGDSGLQAEQLLIDMRDKILSGKENTKDIMKKTEDKINELLKKENK